MRLLPRLWPWACLCLLVRTLDVAGERQEGDSPHALTGVALPKALASATSGSTDLDIVDSAAADAGSKSEDKAGRLVPLSAPAPAAQHRGRHCTAALLNLPFFISSLPVPRAKWSAFCDEEGGELLELSMQTVEAFATVAAACAAPGELLAMRSFAGAPQLSTSACGLAFRAGLRPAVLPFLECPAAARIACQRL